MQPKFTYFESRMKSGNADRMSQIMFLYSYQHILYYCTKDILISDHEIMECKILRGMRKTYTRPWTSGGQILTFQKKGRQDPVRSNSKEKTSSGDLAGL